MNPLEIVLFASECLPRDCDYGKIFSGRREWLDMPLLPVVAIP